MVQAICYQFILKRIFKTRYFSSQNLLSYNSKYYIKRLLKYGKFFDHYNIYHETFIFDILHPRAVCICLLDA